MRGTLEWLRARMFWVVLSLVAGFIGMIVLVIYRTPASGGASRQDLVSLVQRAVDTKSPSSFASAFRDPSGQQDLSSSYVQRLSRERIDPIVVSYRTAPIPGVLVSGRSPSGSEMCTLWAVDRSGGRWYLDGVPTVSGGGCGA